MTNTVLTTPTTDHEIRDAVQAELAWTPDVVDAGIGVAVVDGTVTLSGQVSDYAARGAVTRAAFRIAGVTTVVDDLVVHPGSYAWQVTETDIAKDVDQAIGTMSTLPGIVRADIRQHTVTLTGQVQWEFQRKAVRRAVAAVRGVTFVVNDVTLLARPSAVGTEQDIRAALIRNATVDAEHVTVSVAGTTVTLTGRVRSWTDRKQAETTAWSSPHVAHVINDITLGR
ncbi:BON domain-containing protein [Frigoribacterium sp. VKM Ac-2530]|uniref:BON domain-containing protein n=1 Tax=Frigoribacterium sp. VKM Ac-2530 TaxID=2783822 RepID=UPI00188D88EE|nr:BON domain-containing protein [Frigoribacterium sp. VKM Ac-2530]MBF4578421.1 BON domain-containing protein [Frigoribacterium sp. VKM Ac-2530]